MTTPSNRLVSFFETAKQNPVNPARVASFAKNYGMTFGFEAEVIFKREDSDVDDYMSDHPELDEDERPDELLQFAARLLEDALKGSSNEDVDYTHSPKSLGGDYTYWRVTTDESVGYVMEDTAWDPDLSDYVDVDTIYHDEEGNSYGLEIVSPVFDSYADFMEGIKRVFDLFNSSHMFETNKTAGLHINIGFRNKTTVENIDYLKLLVYMGEENLLSTFGRSDNKFTISLLEQLYKLYGDNKLQFSTNKEFKKLVNELNMFLVSNANHYRTIDLNKLSKGYLEFRLTGNTKYERKYKDIEKTVMRYITGLHIALNETILLKDYMSKLYKMFGKHFDSVLTELVDENLRSLDEIVQDIYESGVQHMPTNMVTELTRIRALKLDKYLNDRGALSEVVDRLISFFYNYFDETDEPIEKYEDFVKSLREDKDIERQHGPDFVERALKVLEGPGSKLPKLMKHSYMMALKNHKGR